MFKTIHLWNNCSSSSPVCSPMTYVMRAYTPYPVLLCLRPMSPGFPQTLKLCYRLRPPRKETTIATQVVYCSFYCSQWRHFIKEIKPWRHFINGYQYLLQYLFYLKSQCIFPFNYFSCDVHSSACSRVMNLSPLSTSLYTITYVINPKVQSVFRDFPNASENYRPMPAHYMSVRRDTDQASIYPNIIFANFGVF